MAKIREISPCATGTFKNGIRIPRIYLASVLALCAVGLASTTEIAWQPQNGSSDTINPFNWVGGVLPGNGGLKKFGNDNLGKDYTVKIPTAAVAHPYRGEADRYIDGLNDGQTLTINATGTPWCRWPMRVRRGMATFRRVAVRGTISLTSTTRMPPQRT